jgi:type I restriction enzyme S subunit
MKLGEVMKLSKGNLINIKNDIEYTIAGVQNYGLGIVNRRIVKGIDLTMKKYQLIKPNQLMWCKVDTKNGAFGITKNEHTNSLASTNMALADIDTTKCHPEFIEYLFRISSFHEMITKASSGTTNRKYLTPNQLFENIEIPNFNLDEQLKWLEKVDSIINSGLTTELNHQFSLVKKLRQQLLQDAVQGKLVPQNKNDEPASELLKKIKAEKKLKKENDLPPIKPEELPFEIPKNWEWCRLGDLGALRRGPFGSALTKGIFVKEGYKVYEQRNAIYDNHTLGEYFVTKEKFEELKAFRIFPKDLIVSCSGATLGRIAEIPEDARDGIMNQALMRIKLFNSTITNSYFIKLFRSPFMQKNIFSQAWGSAIPNMVGLVEIKKILIPLPPLTEQERIVQKLDELMQYCNELEASIKESEIQNEKLLQQVLREALRKAV